MQFRLGFKINFEFLAGDRFAVKDLIFERIFKKDKWHEVLFFKKAEKLLHKKF
jgi:hypothetical protein